MPRAVATVMPGLRADHLVPPEQQIVDAAGGIGFPWRRLDTLARMARAGVITGPLERAGETFHAQFRQAALDPLQAADPTRIPVLIDRGNRAWRGRHGPEAARRQVMIALDALGGPHQPGGSCAWHVLGCEWTLAEWGAARVWGSRRIDPRAASGILLMGLGLLARHYQLA